jgi:hypothetical protein
VHGLLANLGAHLTPSERSLCAMVCNVLKSLKVFLPDLVAVKSIVRIVPLPFVSITFFSVSVLTS